MNICIFTTVCIDKNVSEHSAYVSAGSPAIFMSKIFKQFGNCKVDIISSYGPDFVKYISGFNIFPSFPNAEKTLIYENVSKAGFRTQKSYNRNEAFAVKLDDSIIDVLNKADIVCFAPLQPVYTKEYLQSVLKHLKTDALKVLLPQGFYRKFDSKDNVLVRQFKEAKDILPLVDIIVVSRHDSPTMLDQAKEWALNTNAIPVVTLGEEGAIYFKGSKEIIIPTNAVPDSEIIDSVGSGEVFTAAFVYKYRQTENLEESGKFANTVARQCLFYKASDIKIDLSKIS